MALREIRLIGDEMLTKPCREVKEITPRIAELIADMLETMYDADGIGLAAPQVGVLRRVVIIDIWQPGVEEAEEKQLGEDTEETGEEAAEAETGTEEPSSGEDAAEAAAGENEQPSGEDVAEEVEEEEDEGPLIMINPVITHKEGEQTGDEGCLSLPGKVGTVTRPNQVTVTYFDENMEEYELEADGLLARAICHEVDHLEGHTYVEFVEGEIRDAGYSDSDEDGEEGEASEENGGAEQSVEDGKSSAEGNSNETGEGS